MVHIKSIDKEIFPYYIRPKENELFSSWLCRLAIEHKVKPQSFIFNYFGKNSAIWNRDIDLLAPQFLINEIEKHTPLKKTDVENLFIKSFESYAFESLSLKGGATENILPIGVQHRKRKRYGLLFCSKCLNSGDPYYKKEWRLATSILCLDCNEYLQDRCLKCKTPISFHRINISNNVSIMDFRPLNLCSNCNTDLSKLEVEKKPTPIEIDYQKFINSTIKLGYNNISNHSFSYIKVLLLLAKKQRYNSENNRFRNALMKDFNMNFPKSNENIIYWNILNRRDSLVFSFFLLKHISTLKLTIDKNSVGRSYLDPENTLPFWFLEKIYC